MKKNRFYILGMALLLASTLVLSGCGLGARNLAKQVSNLTKKAAELEKKAADINTKVAGLSDKNRETYREELARLGIEAPQGLFNEGPALFSGAGNVNVVGDGAGTDDTAAGTASSGGSARGGNLTWTAVEDSPFGADRNNNLYDVAFGNGMFVAVGRDNKVAYSPDGRNWAVVTDTTFRASDDISAVAFGNGMFIAVGPRMASSTDGTSWTAVNHPFRYGINAIAYGGGRFVAVGNNGETAYSTDGRSWTPVAATNAFGEGTSGSSRNNIYAAAFGSNRWVAAGERGKMAYSADGFANAAGESWTAVADSTFGAPSSSSTPNVNGIAFGSGRFVAVGSGGRMAYSTDGATWTQTNSAFAGTGINGITFGNGMFVAVGSGGRMAYSTDGATWTTVGDSGFDTTSIARVAFGNNRFVAVGDDGKIAYAEW